MAEEIKKKTYFVSFCIELLKNARVISGSEAARLLNECGALDYICNNFEVLHTQGTQWILAEIE